MIGPLKNLPFLLSWQWLALLSSTVTATSDIPFAQLKIPAEVQGASIAHQPSYVSFSIEPAFWVEFIGNDTAPNKFTFDVLKLLIDHGGNPQIRPGGETMDSMIFKPTAGNPVRDTSSDGGIYRTTVGPAYYKSWSHFPKGTKFTSTLNFGNDSLEIAKNMAVASVKYQPDRVQFFELGNEPNNYGDASTRWNNSAQEYVQQWKNWTMQIDAAVNATLGKKAAKQLGITRWWGSSATTDPTTLQVKPVDIIPDGVDSNNQVAQYSIHSYQFASCDPQRAALATIPNVLNHTLLAEYADQQIVPSAQAALNSGRPWIIGEYNSIACSGSVNVSNTFTQALWTIDTQLLYAVRNASATYLHQGATLVFQSSNQVNTGGPNGTPGYSTYDMLYPRDSPLRGPARTLPGFLGILFNAEVFGTPGIRIQPLQAPTGVDPDYFSAYAMYKGDKLRKIAILNMNPYYGNTTADYGVSVKLPKAKSSNGHQAWVKRLTTTSVAEQNSSMVSWAGQSYEAGKPSGRLNIENVGKDGTVKVRGSEAVLVLYDRQDVVGL